MRYHPGLDPIDVGSGRRLDRVKLISNTTDLVLAGERLWAVIRYTDSIWQLDPASGLLQRTLPVGGLPEGLVLLDDALWVTSQVDAILQRVDAGTGETELVIPIGHQLEDVAAAADGSGSPSAGRNQRWAGADPAVRQGRVSKNFQVAPSPVLVQAPRVASWTVPVAAK